MHGHDTLLAGCSAVVTGASGFLGSVLVDRLVRAGAHVHAVTRGPAGLPGERPVRWRQVDLTDAVATNRLVHSIRPDVVFHLASRAAGAPDPTLVLPILRSNLMSSVHLMSAAAEAGSVRLVLAGSMQEPGSGEDGRVSSPYAVAKWATTEYARMFHQLWDVPVTVLRVAMAYGPGQRNVDKLIPHVVLSMLRNRQPQLTSGSRGIDWVYVDDVIDAFIAAALQPEALGHVIPVGSGRSVSIRETVALINELVGHSPPPQFGAVADRKLEDDRIADPSMAAALLGWRPHVDLVQGMSRTVTWYRERLALGEFSTPD